MPFYKALKNVTSASFTPTEVYNPATCEYTMYKPITGFDLCTINCINLPSTLAIHGLLRFGEHVLHT